MGSAVAGAVLGIVFQELYRATVAAGERATSFRHELRLLQSTLKTVTPKIEQIDRLTSKKRFPKELLEEIQMFKLLLVRGKDLVMTCSNIPRWRSLKRYRYAKKIRNFNQSLGNLVKIQLTGVQLDVILRVLTESNHVSQKLFRNDIQHQFSSIPNASPINAGPGINRTEYQSHIKAINCCSCGIRGPACLGSHP